MSIDLSTPETFQNSWANQPRPLFIVDECRQPKIGGGEYILFSFIQTDTATAVKWATEAHNIKSSMTQKKLPTVLKGKDLFGKNQQHFHQPYRDFVKDKIKQCSQLSFLLIDSALLPAIIANAPSGITLLDRDSSKGISKATGRELSPFLNCIKAITVDRKLTDPVIDVLIDRSFQLGLDPASRKINHDQFQLIGPGVLTPNLKTEFLFVSTGEAGAFADLLVLPDSLAYMLLYLDSTYIDIRKNIIQGNGQLYYWHDRHSNIPANLLA